MIRLLTDFLGYSSLEPLYLLTESEHFEFTLFLHLGAHAFLYESQLLSELVKELLCTSGC